MVSFPFCLFVFTSLCNSALNSALEWNAWAIPSSWERPVSFRSWAAEPTWKGTDTPRPHLWWNCYSLTPGKMVHVRPFGRMLSWHQASRISDGGPWLTTAWGLWGGKQNVRLCTFKDILKTSSNKSAGEQLVFQRSCEEGLSEWPSEMSRQPRSGWVLQRSGEGLPLLSIAGSTL